MIDPTSIVHEWDQLWVTEGRYEMMHIIPVDDLIGHELIHNCVCGPYCEYLGKESFLVAHYALDKRPE